MVDPIEELLQIEIDHDPIALGDVLPCLGEGIVRPAPRAKAGTRGRERRIEDRLQDVQDGLLDQAVLRRTGSPYVGMPS